MVDKAIRDFYSTAATDRSAVFCLKQFCVKVSVLCRSGLQRKTEEGCLDDLAPLWRHSGHLPICRTICCLYRQWRSFATLLAADLTWISVVSKSTGKFTGLKTHGTRLETVTTGKMRMVGFWDVILCSLGGRLALVDKILFFVANERKLYNTNQQNAPLLN
jgi:hypothetical protein